MTPDEIRAYHGHPSLLDRLPIATPRGQLMGMFGLGAELYVAPRENHADLCYDMLKVQKNYYQRFKEHLDRLWLDNHKTGDGRIKKLTDDPFPEIREPIDSWPRDMGFENILFKAYTHPDFPGDANTVTPWLSAVWVTAEKKKQLSTYKCYLPVADPVIRSHLHFDVLKEDLLEWCTLLRPAHGSAGYSVILESGAISGEPYCYPFLQRHPGLNIFQTVNFIGDVKQTYNRIKTINWLTVLGDEVLAELGGLDAARLALGPEAILHPYPGGVVIQACEVPLLGDTHRDDIPEAYRRVARFTRPVRFEDYRSSLFKVFEPLDRKEETRKWIRRFD